MKTDFAHFSLWLSSMLLSKLNNSSGHKRETYLTFIINSTQWSHHLDVLTCRSVSLTQHSIEPVQLLKTYALVYISLEISHMS